MVLVTGFDPVLKVLAVFLGGAAQQSGRRENFWALIHGRVKENTLWICCVLTWWCYRGVSRQNWDLRASRQKRLARMVLLFSRSARSILVYDVIVF